MSNKFKESLKVTKLFSDEELEILRKKNDRTFDENSEEFRPLGGPRISEDMSHLVSEERMQELFEDIVLNSTKVNKNGEGR